MLASGFPLTMVLVAALSSSLTYYFAGYQNDNDSSSQFDKRDLRGRASYGYSSGGYYGFSDPYNFNGKWDNGGNNYYGRPSPYSSGSGGKYPKPYTAPRPYSQPGGGQKPSSGGRRVGDAFGDEMCQNFCTNFFAKCQNYNVYTNPKAWEWEGNVYKNNRRLSANKKIQRDLAPKISKEPPQGRKDTLEEHEDAFADCLQVCMNWPRPMDPGNYTGSVPRDSTGGGDHFWCRRWHLNQVADLNNAAFHCPHATDSSLGICRDAQVDGASPYEWLRRGASSMHRQALCDIAGGGTVVDCTMGGINDDNLHDVLISLPDTMEFLFLNGNTITKINGPLSTHLQEPTKLKAIYINDNGLTTVSADALKGLDNLEVWNVDVNEVSTLDKDFLQYTPKLKHFSMHDNPQLFSPSIPAGFFRHTPKLEIMFMYGTGVETFLPGTFDGLTSLTLMSFITQNKITEESFPNPPELFKDLTSLRYFDFFGTNIKSIPENFFGPWASKVIRLAFWNCPITSIHENAGLEYLKGIEQVYFHENRVDGVPQPPPEGGSFEFAPVLNIMTELNAEVMMTYGYSPKSPQRKSTSRKGRPVIATQQGTSIFGNTNSGRALHEDVGLDVAQAEDLAQAVQKAINATVCTHVPYGCNVEILRVEKAGAGYIIGYESIFILACNTFDCSDALEEVNKAANATSAKLQEAVSGTASQPSLSESIAQSITDTSLQNEIAHLPVVVESEPVELSYDPMHPLFPTQTPSTAPSSSPSTSTKPSAGTSTEPSFKFSSKPSLMPSERPSTGPSSEPSFGLVFYYYPAWLEMTCKRKTLDEFNTWESAPFDNIGDCCYKTMDWDYTKCVHNSMLLINSQIDVQTSSQPSNLPSSLPSSQPTSKPNFESSIRPSSYVITLEPTESIAQSITDTSLQNEIAHLPVVVESKPVELSYDPMHPLFHTQTPSTAPSSSPSTSTKPSAGTSTEPSFKFSSKPSLMPSERPSTGPSSEPSFGLVFYYYSAWLEMTCKRKTLDEFNTWESAPFDNIGDCCYKTMDWDYTKCVHNSMLLINSQIDVQTSSQPSNLPSSLPSSQPTSKPNFESSIHPSSYVITLEPIIHPGNIFYYYPDWLEMACKRKTPGEFSTWESAWFDNVGDCCYKSMDWDYMKCYNNSVVLIDGEINAAPSQPSLQPSLQTFPMPSVSSSSQPSSKPGSQLSLMHSESPSSNSSASTHPSGLPILGQSFAAFPTVQPNSIIEEPTTTE